uniref:Uncharacterized protein n=1 Tax=Panagrolaimus sp. JU765 TaxID=591449 RepID=A0AC34R7Q9_9BILA
MKAVIAIQKETEIIYRDKRRRSRSRSPATKDVNKSRDERGQRDSQKSAVNPPPAPLPSKPDDIRVLPGNSTVNPYNGLPYSVHYFDLLTKRKQLPVWDHKTKIAAMC